MGKKTLSLLIASGAVLCFVLTGLGLAMRNLGLALTFFLLSLGLIGGGFLLRTRSRG